MIFSVRLLSRKIIKSIIETVARVLGEQRSFKYIAMRSFRNHSGSRIQFFVFKMRSSVGDGPLPALARKLTQASRMLTPKETHQACKMCEVAKVHLNQRACELVDQAHGRPILFSHSSDGTPALAKKTVTAQIGSRTVARKGGEGAVFLAQRAYLRSQKSTGEPTLAVVLRDPLPMSSGKHLFMV